MLCSEHVWCLTNVLGSEVATVPVKTSSAANSYFTDIWIAFLTQINFQHNQQILKNIYTYRYLNIGLIDVF